MSDPFTIVDTLSLPDDPAARDAEAATPPVLARLPRLPETTRKPPATDTITRVDPAESLHHPSYLEDAAPLESGPLDEIDPSLGSVVTRPAPADPTATIRIDTVRPTEFSDDAVIEAHPVAVAPARNQGIPERAPTQPADAAVTDDPFTDWLIDVESAVLPYSRWIALAAITAALGLTVILLRGAETPTQEPTGGPRVEIEGSLDDPPMLAGSVDPAAVGGTPPAWPDPEPLADAALRPLDDPAQATEILPEPPALAAAGPASAARRQPRARLVGDVLPADTIVPDTEYPRTATAPRATEGPTR